MESRDVNTCVGLTRGKLPGYFARATRKYLALRSESFVYKLRRSPFAFSLRVNEPRGSGGCCTACVRHARVGSKKFLLTGTCEPGTGERASGAKGELRGNADRFRVRSNSFHSLC